MKKLIFGLIIGMVLLVCNVQAIDMNVYPREWNTTTISYASDGNEMFYTNNTVFVDNLGFYYDEGLLRITVFDAPSTIGMRTIHILTDRETNETEDEEYVTTLNLNVIEPLEEEPEEDDTTECGTLQISLIGVATRGKMAIIRVSDGNGDAIIATVSVTDPMGNAEILITNSPTKGFGSFKIPEDADVPIVLIAFAENCNSGTYTVNELKGEKLSPEDEDEILPILRIDGLPEESMHNVAFNGTVIDSDGNLIASEISVIVTTPSGSVVKAQTNTVGVFKVWGANIGNYVVRAELDGYEDSPDYAVNVRNPRVPMYILAFRNGHHVTDGVVYTDEVVSFGLYSNNQRVNDTVSGTVEVNGKGDSVEFTNGVLSYRVPEEGVIRVMTSQSYNYLEADVLDLESVSSGFGWLWIVIVVVALVVVIILILVLLKRRGGTTGPDMGFRSGESGSTSAPMEFESSDEFDNI